jgi:hypothetical protein
VNLYLSCAGDLFTCEALSLVMIFVEKTGDFCNSSTGVLETRDVLAGGMSRPRFSQNMASLWCGGSSLPCDTLLVRQPNAMMGSICS